MGELEFLSWFFFCVFFLDKNRIDWWFKLKHISMILLDVLSFILNINIYIGK